ncbi:MAG TPA: haloacid dehalogenase type II [Candidatus Dormibacteraeota bacterium]|nr:haloacid dehalogenase type II [Candidatus Dormibacteraeota bacterium]
MIAEVKRVASLRGIGGDWERLADDWRALYLPYMNRVRVGDLPWTNFDALHRMSLDEVLTQLGIDGFDAADRDELTRSWERLPAWPDADAGLQRLATRFTVTTLSNGNRSQQQALMQYSSLPFRRLLSAEDFKHYKPDPEIYQGAAKALGFRPEQVLMVAAHKGDLRAADAAGLHTAFVERPLEKGPGGGSDRLPDPDSDIQATDFVDLAVQLGC